MHCWTRLRTLVFSLDQLFSSSWEVLEVFIEIQGSIGYLQARMSIFGVCNIKNFPLYGSKCVLCQMFLKIKVNLIIWYLYNLEWDIRGIIWNQKFYIIWGTINHKQVTML
jgi:hypothetical protein